MYTVNGLNLLTSTLQTVYYLPGKRVKASAEMINRLFDYSVGMALFDSFEYLLTLFKRIRPTLILEIVKKVAYSLCKNSRDRSLTAICLAP